MTGQSLLPLLQTELEYSEENTAGGGVFINKVHRSHNAPVGMWAGSINSGGYRVIRLNGKHYYEHRLVWLWHHGYFPQFIDHANRCKTDNRISNLRECTHYENHRNTKLKRTNTSGFKGVSWASNINKWRAGIYIREDGKLKRLTLGYFESKEEAAAVYERAAREWFGEFANP